MVTRRRRCTIGLYASAVALIGLALATLLLRVDHKRLYDGLVPFKRSLTAQGAHGSFLAVWSEPHEVTVGFRVPTGIPEADAFVRRATDLVGHYQRRPAFDVKWRVYEKGVLVGSGSGSGGASAVSFGQASRLFGLGKFPVTAGRTYDVVVDVGPEFAPLLRAAPWVEVAVATATASVGLAFAESLGNTAAWVVGTLGAAVLGIALWYQRFGTGRPTRR
jgi:hypothetical protein